MKGWELIAQLGASGWRWDFISIGLFFVAMKS
jgi:hypothetical protein